jgi:hypothetical protein
VIDALHRLDAGSGDDRDAAPEFIVEGKDRQRRESSAEPAEDRSNAFGEDHRLHYAIAWAAAQGATRPQVWTCRAGTRRNEPSQLRSST